MENKRKNPLMIVLTIVISVILLGVMLIVLLLGTDIPALRGAKLQVAQFFGITNQVPDVTQPEETQPEETQPLNLKSYTVDAEKAKQIANEVVATTGADELTNAQLQIYYQMFYASNAIYMQYYYGLDTSLPLDEQVYDTTTNMTWQEFVLENSLAMWNQYSAIKQTAEAEGYELDAEAQEYVANIDKTFAELLAQTEYATLDEMLQSEMGAGVTEEVYREYVLMYHYVMEYMADKEEGYAPTQEELDAYYQANASYYMAYGILQDDGDVVDVRHVLIRPEGGTTDETTGETTYSDEEWEACRQKAQTLLDDWRNGEATEESFGQLAMDNSADGNASEGGLYEQVVKGYMVETYNDWIFDDSRKYGDTDLVKTQFGYHIMYFVKREQLEEPLWIETVKPDWITEQVNAFVQTATEVFPMTANYDVIGISETEVQ